VVILTGQLAPGDPRAADAQVCAVLLKPCPNDQLLATVQELLAAGPHDHIMGCAAKKVHSRV
jgi:hypothetical protein